MLFTPDRVLQERGKLLSQGNHPTPAAIKRLLELDPEDAYSTALMAHHYEETGNRSEAVKLHWRALHLQPCAGASYIALARFLAHDGESRDLRNGLLELGFRKMLLTGEDDAELAAATTAEAGEIPKMEGLQQVADAYRANRHLEPASVSEVLRPYRILHSLEEDPAADRTRVDSILSEGKVMLPLLIGALRGWAQALVRDADDFIETVLALIGEMGDVTAIPAVLEFAALDEEILCGAATWALRRMVELNPAAAARELMRIAPHAGAADRFGIAGLVFSMHDKIPDKAALFGSLTENLHDLDKGELVQVFPALLTLMIGALHRPGLQMARTVLRQNARILSKKLRSECGQMIDELDHEALPALPPSLPSSYTVYDICEGLAEWGDPEEEDDDDEDGEEQDEDLEVMDVEPVRRTHTPERNEPCWCGSGKKYKKCHLAEDQEALRHRRSEGLTAPAARNTHGSLRQRIAELLHNGVTASSAAAAMADHRCGDEPDAFEAATFADWSAHDWVVPGFGRNVMQEFLRRNDSRLTAREREMVESWSRSFVSLHEVVDVRRGMGMELKDLTSGAVEFVHDVSLSRQAVKWDGLLARVVDGERGRELTGIGIIVPRMHLDRLLSWLEKDKRQMRLGWPEYLKANIPRVRHHYRRLLKEGSNSLLLSNTDREELMQSKAFYRIENRAALIAALEASDDMTNSEEDHFVWLAGTARDESRTVLGHLRLQGSELVLECNSRPRLKRGKEGLARIAGGSVRFLRDEFTSAREVIDGLRKLEQGKAGIHKSIPEMDNLVLGALDRHYSTWVDTPLPALGGETPRQAVESSDGRERVKELLREFENHAERDRNAGRPAYDISRIRAQLELYE